MYIRACVIRVLRDKLNEENFFGVFWSVVPFVELYFESERKTAPIISRRGKKQRREARDAFWTKQFAFFPRVDKCSLFNQERENVETHLGKFPFILAVAMIRIFFFFSLDGANVTLRVYLTFLSPLLLLLSRDRARELRFRVRA
jgi:hypothetical protein